MDTIYACPSIGISIRNLSSQKTFIKSGERHLACARMELAFLAYLFDLTAYAKFETKSNKPLYIEMYLATSVQRFSR